MKLTVLVKKPLRDLDHFRSSCVLLFLAMSAAVTGATAFVVAWSVLDRETDRSFSETRPVHVEAIVEEPMSNEQAHDWIARLNAAAAAGSELELFGAEPARRLVGRVETSEGFRKTLVLWIRPDDAFLPGRAPRGIALLEPSPESNATEAQSTPSLPGLFVERSAIRVLQPGRGPLGSVDVEIAHRVRLPELGDAPPPKVSFRGDLFDGSQAPGWMENRVYGYVADSSLTWVGLGPQQATPWDRI